MERNEYSVVSLDTELDECEEVFEYVDKEAEEIRLRRIRKIKLASLVVIFIVSIGVLVFSVIHDLHLRTVLEVEEFICQENDWECLDLLCPQGMEWDGAEQKCQPISGTC